MTRTAMETVNLIWEKAKDIILEWDGSATELFTLNVPLDKLPIIISKIREVSQNPMAINIDNWTLENEVKLDDKTVNKIIAASTKNSQHAIQGNFSEKETCVYYVWVDADKKLLEVEMAFWNDTSFPKGKSEEEHKRTLAKYVSVANDIKLLGEECVCILSNEWNGNTNELLQKEWAVIW
jgi:hypothetical protein